MKNWGASLSLWIPALLVVFFLVRIPFLSQPMVHEEGLFADLYLHGPSAPDYGLMARIHGQEVRSPLDHPGPLYAAMTTVGRMARVLGWAPQNGPRDGAMIRFLNSLFQGLFWVLLMLLLPAPSPGRGWGLLGTLVILVVSPLAVGSSLYPQTDNTVGLLVCGLLAMAIQRGPVVTWAAAATLLGFSGKQEWNICVVLALGMAGAWGMAAGRKQWFVPLGFVLLGTLVGSYLSWLYDPINWIGGVQVMLRVSTANNVVARPGGIGHWALNLILLSPFLIWLALGLMFLAFRAWDRGWKKADLRGVLRLVLPLALTVPFLMSTWGREYRYFVPAFAASVVGLLFEFSTEGIRSSWRPRRCMAGFGLFTLVYLTGAWVLGRSITEAPPLSLRKTQMDQEEVLKKAGEKRCLPVLSTGFAYASGTMDFVDESLSQEDQRKIAAQAGLDLCP